MIFRFPLNKQFTRWSQGVSSPPMRIMRHIPNLLTLANLTAGTLACIAILQYDNLRLATMLVLTGALFDFFDGFAARLLKVSGELGKQLDSLADMVTFGLVPGLLVYSLLRLQLPHNIWLSDNPWLTCVPLLMVVLSAYRLARFNIDTRQSDSFIGLPTPANALFWISVPMVVVTGPIGIGPAAETTPESGFLFDHFMAHPVFLLIGAVLFALLLNANLPLIAMKFKHFKWRDNEWRYVFISLAAAALLLSWLLLQNVFAGFPVIILLYLIISAIGYRKKATK